MHRRTLFQAVAAAVSGLFVSREATNNVKMGSYLRWSSGLPGWQITPSGNAEFNDIWARGGLHAKVFVKDEVRTCEGHLQMPDSHVLSSGNTVDPNWRGLPTQGVPAPVAPGMATWQCPGCGRIYTVLTASCDCQMHRWVRSSITITGDPFDTRTG